MQTLFSVILTTRDRPALFKEAIDSVMAQNFADFEVIVVNDGSKETHVAAYQEIWESSARTLGPRLQVCSLVHRPKGHGQSYAINFGAAQSQAEYLCFLDDDDRWTDPDHLANAARAIHRARAQGQRVDLYMTNQCAWIDAQTPVGVLWLGELASQLKARMVEPNDDGNFLVTVDDLMAAPGFCHLNCLTARRALFNQAGGMDEGIRWECDRDIYLKLIEASQYMLHNPVTMAYHRVPDPKQANNMTTTLGMLEKRLLQTLVLDRALLRSRHPAIKRHARLHKAYALKKIATEFAAAGAWSDASFYAAQALGAAPGVKWLLFSLHCFLRSAVAKPATATR